MTRGTTTNTRSNNTNTNRGNTNNRGAQQPPKNSFGQPVVLGNTGLEVTDMRIYPANNAGKLLATATVTLNGCLVLKKLKVIEGKTGSFLAMPSESYDSDGEKKFVDMFFFLDKDAREKLEELVITEFETM